MAGTGSTTSQVNARLDAALKARGDRALSQAGLTPTQAVRDVWELAVRYSSEPEKLLAILEPDRIAREENAQAELRERTAKAIDAGSSLLQQAFAKSGVPWPSTPDQRSYDDLKKEAYLESCGRDMGWDG